MCIRDSVKEEVLCEERGQIHVKGIAYPIGTFEVIGLRADLAESVTPLRAELPNIRCEVQLDKMSAEEREQAATMLRDLADHISGPRDYVVELPTSDGRSAL